MKVVKKLISLLLSVLMCFGASFILCFALDETAGAETKKETVASENFFNALNKMVVEYDLNSVGSSVVGGSYETDRIVVKTITNNALTDTCGAVDVLEGWNCVHILQYSDTDEANAALEYYKSQDYVEYAEMDVYYTFSSGATTEEIVEYTESTENTSWGTSAVNLDYLNNLIEESGRVTKDDEVVVAVFDSGLMETHFLFDNRNRFYDGYNVFEENTDTSDGDIEDSGLGHGTHVSGIIYENTLDNVKIRPYRVNLDLGNNKYSTAMTILGTAIYTAVDIGDDLINVSMSWGSYGNEYLTDAIEYAYDNNVPMIAAAGNDTINARWIYPANLDEVITVSAVDENFAPATFSNFGSCVDLAAPGVRIKSACGNMYMLASASGTSMSAPFVSAAVAMLKLIYPDITSQEITDILKSNVVVPTGWDSDYGVGVLNCKNFMSIYKTAAPKIVFNDDGNIVFSASSNAMIYYTTDGTAPVVGESEIYSSPISTKNVTSIRAVAYEAGKLASDESILAVKWTVAEDMYYKSTITFDDLKVPPNTEIIAVYSSDENVITVNKSEREIYAASQGEAKVYFYLENNRRITVNVTVEYNIFQWFIIIFLCGYFWYI